MGGKINILVASWHDDECKRVLTVLSGSNDFFIAGIEKDVSDVIIKAERLKPDVIIMGFQFSGLIVTELAPIIRRRSPNTGIVALCEKDESGYAGLALEAGIAGLLLKETDADKLALVVKIIFLGGCYISRSIIVNLFKIEQSSEQESESYCPFSPKERKIAAALAQGLSDAEIAALLNYSIGTIKNCVTYIKRKTKLKNRVQIAIYSLVRGIIRLEQILFLNEI